MKKILFTLSLLMALCCGLSVNADAPAGTSAGTSAGKAVPLNEQTARPIKKWLAEGVIYQINPRAYTPEGTLKAAEAKLPEIAELGATIVYLCPVFVADDDMNKQFWSPRQKASGMDSPLNPYRMKDFYHVDPEYGTDEDLKSYIETAHGLGLRVMLDMVYLHCGPTAVFIKDHPDFVKRDKDGNIQNAAWAFPGLNFESAELREYLHQNMEMWVRDYKVDGFRMDVADGVPLDFWEDARVRLEKINPEVGMLAEGTNVRNQLHAFDLSYGFHFFGEVRKVYDQNASVMEIRKIKETLRKNRPIGGDRIIHFIDTHDISNDDYQNRIEKRWGEKGVNAMLAVMFTLDGVPFIYCGQEVCDKNRHSIFGSKNGCKVDWENASSDEAKRRKAVIQGLAEIRKARPELTAGKLVWLDNTAQDDVLTFSRILDEKETLVVVNLRAKSATTTVTLPDGTKKEFQLGEYEYVIE